MEVSQINIGKQPNKVRGNIIQCINFQQCPMCYGCRNYDSRLEECRECWEDGIKPGQKRNYNVCNTDLHESWKVNRMICKNTIDIKGIDIEGEDIDE